MTPPPVSRRHFVKTTTLLGAAASLAPLLDSSATAADDDNLPAARPSWVNRPHRWGQLTLVENDPGTYDLNFWLDYFQRTHCDGVCLSAGGCVAYYPTTVLFHHRSAWLGNMDPFGDLVAGCRQRGMVILARTDPHATYDDVQAAHPDWIAVDAQGKPMRHWASPEMWVTCGLGPYNFDFMTDVKKEITTRYHPDGIFINRWDGSGQCYCEHCRANFKAASGFDLPTTRDPQDPARRAYIVWRQQRLFQLWRHWDAAVRAINPDSCVIPNTGGGALSTLDMKAIGELTPMLVADRQARRGLMPPWANGKNAKEYRAALGPKPIAGLFSVGVEEPERWKDSVQDPAEIRIWVLDGIANGLQPWFCKFGGVLQDPRWLAPVEKIYTWHKKWERYLRHEQPLAQVGLVYSQQTAQFYGGEKAAAKVEDYTLGWYQTLIEARLPFEMVHDRLLDQTHLANFRTLILPNIAALSDDQCRQLTAFSQSGGNLIATYETSLYDEWGMKRKNFGLAELFGVQWNGRTEGPMQNSYLHLDHTAVTGHPLLSGLEDAPRIINGVWRLDVSPRAPFDSYPLTLIPSYPDLPMEKVYPRAQKTDIAGVYLRQNAAGRSRTVYFPWDIDRTFWEILSPDHFKLLRNAVQWANHAPSQVEVTGPGFVEVTAWRNRDSYVIHLVNLSNPMAMKGPYREFLPVGPQLVRLRLSPGIKPRKVHLLVADQSPPTRHDHTDLLITVKQVVDHEVVVIDV